MNNWKKPPESSSSAGEDDQSISATNAASEINHGCNRNDNFISTMLSVIAPSSQIQMAHPQQRPSPKQQLQIKKTLKQSVKSQPPYPTIQTPQTLPFDLYNQGGMQKLTEVFKRSNDPVDAAETSTTVASGGGAIDIESGAATPADVELNCMSVRDFEDRSKSVAPFVEQAIGDHAKQQVMQILDKISLLKPPERLLLYLRLPGGTPETDPLRQSQNPLGTRSEINHTINWVRSHLEADPNVSIPKQDVYNDYLDFCAHSEMKPLSTADFGKVMKQVFPGVRPRRLGTRGNSRYCYAAMRKATKLSPPLLPDMSGAATSFGSHDTLTSANDSTAACETDAWNVIKKWSEELLNTTFQNMSQLSSHITKMRMNTTVCPFNSRMLLHNKILQRTNKDKKRLNDSSGLLKKRRKKKRKDSESSNRTRPTTPLSFPAPDNDDSQSLDGNAIQIKQELLNVGSCNDQLLPINLTNEVEKFHGTNYPCDDIEQRPIDFKHLTKPNAMVRSTLLNITDKHHNLNARTVELVQPDAATTVSNNIFYQANSQIYPIDTLLHNSTMVKACNYNNNNNLNVKNNNKTPMKQNVKDSYRPCKKVRQAQQIKLWSQQQQLQPSPPSAIQTSVMRHPDILQQQQQLVVTKKTNALISTTNIFPSDNATIMGPPLYSSTFSSTNTIGGSISGLEPHSINYASKRTIQQIASIRPKKYKLDMDASADRQRMDEKSHTPMNLNMAESAATVEASATTTQSIKDNEPPSVPADLFQIPRERVISICNMEKDELDDYLNVGESSTEQEAELLKYFDQDNKTTYNIENTNVINDEISNTFPLLENYQLAYQVAPNANATIKQERSKSIDEQSPLLPSLQDSDTTSVEQIETPKCEKEEQEILMENIPQQRKVQLATTKSTNRPNAFQIHSASASLAMMSQRHSTPDDVSESQILCNIGAFKRSFYSPQIRSADSSSASLNNSFKTLENCSQAATANTRRRDYNFVPISLGHHSPRINLMPNNTFCNGGGLSSDDSFTSSQHTHQRSASSTKMLTPEHQQQQPLQQRNIVGEPINSFESENQQELHRRMVELSGGSPPSPQSNFSRNMVRAVYPSNSKILSNYGSCSSSAPAEYSEMRSQSVPLFYQAPPYGRTITTCNGGVAVSNPNTHSFTTYSLANMSLPQSVAPRDYCNDYADQSILDIFASNENVTKMELSDDCVVSNHQNSLNGLNEILSDITSGGVAQSHVCEHQRNHAIISRSVPSTPVPQLIVNNINNSSTMQSMDNGGMSNRKQSYMYDISKSVPTTPIGKKEMTFNFNIDPTRRQYSNNCMFNNASDISKMPSYYLNNQEHSIGRRSSSSSNGSCNNNNTEQVLTSSIPLAKNTSISSMDDESPFNVQDETIFHWQQSQYNHSRHLHQSQQYSSFLPPTKHFIRRYIE